MVIICYAEIKKNTAIFLIYWFLLAIYSCSIDMVVYRITRQNEQMSLNLDLQQLDTRNMHYRQKNTDRS